jgi:rod shape-determining protein MreC
MIGRVSGYEVDSKTGYWDISVELNQKMGQLQKVFVVRNLRKLELKQIQDTLSSVIKNDQ